MGNSSKLLKEIDPLLGKRAKGHDNPEDPGAHFNIFNILGVLSEQTRFHSAFLAELLNTKGTHGRNDLFLKSFIEIVGQNGLSLDTPNAEILVEYNIGDESEDTGGKIDLLIRSNGKAILIVNNINENAIPNQMVRYANYAKKYDSRILYLTLNGDKPLPSSTGSGKKQIKPNKYSVISYREHITKWLEKCVELSHNQPFVRETTNQYIRLIGELTRQSMIQESNEQIVSMILNNPKYLFSAFSISACLPIIKTEIFKQFIEHLAIKNKVELSDCFDPSLSSIIFKYKGAFLYFGEERGKLYCAIRTEKSMSASDQKIWDADIFDHFTSPSLNPFGWSYVLNDHWNTNPERFYDMSQQQSDLHKTMGQWLQKMKFSIDTELKTHI